MKLRGKRQWSAIIGLVFVSFVLEMNVVSGLTISTTTTPLAPAGPEKAADALEKGATVVTPEKVSTVVTPEKVSTVVTLGIDSTTAVTSEKVSTTVTPEIDSTKVSPGNDETTATPGNESTKVSTGNDETTAPPGNESTKVSTGNGATVATPVVSSGNDATVVSPGTDIAVDLSEDETPMISAGSKTVGATRVKRTEDGPPTDDIPVSGGDPGAEPPAEEGPPQEEPLPPAGEDEPSGGEVGGDAGGGEHGEGGADSDRTIGKPLEIDSVALISWVQADMKEDPAKKYLTVGAIIATNAIVCVPSARVPVKIPDISNWYVESVYVALPPNPPETISKKELVLLIHPDFQMSRDSSNRIALIMIKTDVLARLPPLRLVAAPFLPSIENSRHDDYGLANCKMAVVNNQGNGITHIDMSAISCRYKKQAKNVYKDKICALPKMMSNIEETMVKKNAFPRDLGSPLICGRYVVGVYAGVQNIFGNNYKDMPEDRQRTLGTATLTAEQQYTFDVPGAPRNYEFLSGFVNEQLRNMKWSQRLEVKETNECISREESDKIAAEQQRGEHDSAAGESGPSNDESVPIEGVAGVIQEPVPDTDGQRADLETPGPEP